MTSKLCLEGVGATVPDLQANRLEVSAHARAKSGAMKDVRRYSGSGYRCIRGRRPWRHSVLNSLPG
jgi:hypothetical protein